MKINKKWFPVFIAPTVALFVLIYALPLVIVFVTSFTNYRLIDPNITFAGLDNYRRMFSDADFFLTLRNTIIWILIHCTLHVALGVLLALILYRRPRGWKVVRTAYMIPNIISSAAMGVIFINVFNPQFGVINSVLNLVGLESLTRNWLMNPNTAFTSVTMIWLLFAGYTTTLVLAYALSIDESIIEAAKIDGASAFKLDFFIMLPLLKKMIGTTTVMAAAYMLRMFDLIFITTGGGPGRMTMNLPLLLFNVFRSEHNFGYANTIGVVIIVLGAICMIIINKVFKVNEEGY